MTLSLNRGDASDGRGELLYGLDARAVRPFGYVIIIAYVTLILYVYCHVFYDSTKVYGFHVSVCNCT